MDRRINKTGQVGAWCYEVVHIKLRKTPEFGMPYTGICDFIVVDGELHIEGLLCTDFHSSDAENLEKIANMFGFKEYKSIKPTKTLKEL